MLILLIALIILEVGLISFFTESEKPHPIGAIFVLGGGLALYHFVIQPFNWPAILAFCQVNILGIIIGLIVWVIAGIIWAFIKWYFFLADSKIAQDEGHESLIRQHEKYPTTYKHPGKVKYFIPTAIENKERIITWMIYWPFSIIAQIFGNWIAKMYNRIYRRISGTFDKMAAKRFA